jgi:16S rRNA (cytosine1402-N4)-methyltransferase
VLPEGDFHEPVFLEEVKSFFENLSSRRSAVIYDCNLGGGAHALNILQVLASDSRYVGVDLDEKAIAFAKSRLEAFSNRIVLVNDNYANIASICQKLRIDRVDGIFMDLGLSSFQINHSQKGFSFDRAEELDMRFGTSSSRSATDILNSYDEGQLNSMFSCLGQEKFSRIISRAIVAARQEHAIVRTEQLKKIILEAVPKAGLKPVKTLARIFQALRIEVNGELTALRGFLDIMPEVLRSGGRFACISYHSLEDALVKAELKNLSGICICPPGLPICGCHPRRVFNALDRRATVPTEKEIGKNSRARSAKLRRAIKIDE